MAMTIEQEREAFEKWADENDRNTSMLYGEYVNDTTDSAWDAWQARAHLSQPAQAMDVGLVERLRKRAAEERQIAENNARVAELLAPELARFKAGEEHNVYATRMAIDHRDSAKRDAAFADDLEMAASALAGEKAEGLPWISVDAKRPERNRPAIYWHKSEFGGFAAIADEWCDEHHLAYATHWLPYTPPTDGEE